MWKYTIIGVAAILFLVMVGKTLVDNDPLKRVYIVSQMSEKQLDEFYEMVDGYSNGNLIDASHRPTGISETDVMVFFYDSWEAAIDSHESEVLPDIFAKLDEVHEGGISVVIDTKLTSKQPVRFIFYALKESGLKNISCYAEDLAATISNYAGTLSSCK